MKKVPPKPKKFYQKAYLFYKSPYAVSFFVVLLIFLVALTLLNFVYFRVTVSGKAYYLISTSRFKTLVQKDVSDYQRSNLTLNIDGQDLSIALNDLGVEFSDHQDRVLGLSLKNSLIKNIRNNWLVSTGSFKPSYDVNIDRLSTAFSDAFDKSETKADDAKIVFNKSFEIVSENNGIVIDRTAFILDLRNRIENLSYKPIKVVKYEQAPKFKKEQFSSAFEKIKIIAGQKIILSYNFDTWDLSKEIMNFVVFAPKGKPNFYLARNKLVGKDLTVNDVYIGERPSIDQVDIALDPIKISQYLEDIAETVDRETVDATLSFENGRVTEFTPARDGQKLNGELAVNLILEKLSTDYVSGEKIITISLPVEVMKAKIANEEVNNLGVKELIGSGVSYFAGSIPNRAYNVGLGARRLNGFLVKPGENFSFNEAVGEVSGKTGYKEAYVISAGKTVLDDGGGICQVSTTVFRAALNSGFPIVSRTAHAYRVGYYEQGGFKAGMDATIWQPSVDLKFKNDTDFHILVQATVDPVRAKLQVDIYGTKDDRKVEISDPVVSNFRPAPEPRYQDEPTLPKGTVKQVDFAAVGATSVFTRKVYKVGEKVIDEKITSNFRPWQAVFLVGIGG